MTLSVTIYFPAHCGHTESPDWGDVPQGRLWVESRPRRLGPVRSCGPVPFAVTVTKGLLNNMVSFFLHKNFKVWRNNCVTFLYHTWGTCNQPSAGQPMRIGWPAYRVVGRPLAPVMNSAGQPTQPFFEVLFGLTRRWRRPSRKC